MITYDFNQWDAHFTEHEACVNHFYLDTEGILTIGKGCQVFIPQSLPMLRLATNERATAEEITKEAALVKAMAKGLVAGSYAPACKLFLPGSAINSLLKARIDGTLNELAAKIAYFETYPMAAIFAITDMAFNMGVQRLFDKFPAFTKAFIFKDWKTCAAECDRDGDAWKERNRWTRNQFLTLAAE
jgi:GH24 family phage-related lysozyme (muramidase)